MGRVHAIGNGLHAGVERRTRNLARERTLLDGADDAEALSASRRSSGSALTPAASGRQAYAAVLAELAAVLEGLDGAQGESRTG